jgi:hypothetical protein
MNYPDDPPAPPLHHCHHPLEIVTVCIDYADFLAETLPYNVQHCDRYVVITHPDDYKTRNVCKTHGVQCLLSKDANRHGHQFNKGRLIERALQHTSADGWRLHLDADIVLPARTRHYLKSAELEPDCIYGCDRLMVKSRGEWEKAKQSGVLTQHKWQSAMHYPPLQLGTRWGNESTGYVPIGFFQLWHSSADSWGGIRTRPYPDRHGNACRSDVQFSLLWDRPQRRHLAEIVVFHLESEPAKLGANWKGRKTKRF